VKRKRHCGHATMLRDNPVGLIRADEAAREDSYSPNLSRAAFFHPASPRKNHRTKRPHMPENVQSPPRQWRQTPLTQKIFRPCGIGYLPCLHVSVSYPTSKSLAVVHQTFRDPKPEKDTARYLQKIYVEERDALHADISPIAPPSSVQPFA
jgi:hypothetical protein